MKITLTKLIVHSRNMRTNYFIIWTMHIELAYMYKGYKCKIITDLNIGELKTLEAVYLEIIL